MSQLVANQNTAPDVIIQKADEKILVVPRHKLFPDVVPQGFIVTDISVYQNNIEQSKEFLWRSAMEIDSRYKQIIPYLIFTYNNKYFLMKRKSTASESRLKNSYSLGIGGHIREEDLNSSTKNGIEQWANREFKEEINYKGDFTSHPIGILNDETNAVGQVHTGFVFLLKGNSDCIDIRDEHESGKLLSIDECRAHYADMESWSKMVFDYLVTF